MWDLSGGKPRPGLGPGRAAVHGRSFGFFPENKEGLIRAVISSHIKVPILVITDHETGDTPASDGALVVL